MGLGLKKKKPEKVIVDQSLYILWKDGLESQFDFFQLRNLCPCAHCVDEITGEKRLDPASIRPDIRPMKTEYVGNYALRFYWSDGHSSGIYSFRHLRGICPEAQKREAHSAV